MENSKPANGAEANSDKQQADNGDKIDMLQHEKLIDPGNEHSHTVDEEKKPEENKEANPDTDVPPDKS